MRPLPLLMLTTALLLGACGKKDNNNKVLSKSKPYPIERPFANVKTPVMTQEIDPTKAQTVRFERGIEVEVPADVFVDKNGNKVTAPVQLHLEVYDSPAEVIASGIPMQFNDQNFESGGMFKLTGTAQGQDISIQQGKTLDVAYPSASTGDFNVYYLRQDAAGNGTWEELQTAPTIDYPKDAVKGNFKLKFSNDTSAVFADLEGIDWKLATNERNPNSPDFAWALAQNWDELEISQPLYGLGKRVWADTNNCGYFTTDKERIYVHKVDKSLHMVDRKNGKKIAEIADNAHSYGFSTESDKWVFNDGNGNINHYDKNGNPIFKCTHCWGARILEKEDRQIWVTQYSSGSYDQDTMVLATIAGKEIKRFVESKKTDPFGPSMYYWLDFTTDNLVLFVESTGVQILDLNGNVIKEKKCDVFDATQEEGGMVAIILANNDMVELWDYKTDKTYQAPTGFSATKWKEWNNKKYKEAISFAHRKEHKALYTFDFEGTQQVWFYETGEVVTLRKNVLYHSSSYDTLAPSELLISFIRTDNNLLSIYDLAKHTELLSLEGVRHYNANSDGAYGAVRFSANKKHFVIDFATHSQLYKRSGERVADFRSSDTAIVYTYFISNDVLGTVSSNGTFRTWSVATGQQLSSKIVENAYYLYADGHHEKTINAYDHVSGSNYQYDLYGNLRYGMAVAENEQDSTLLHESYYDDNHCFMAQRFELGKQMYQLYLSKGDKRFITYVYLSQQDMNIIRRYYQFKLEQANKKIAEINREEKRQEREARLTRRFAIAEFGIYNYDLLWNDAETVKLLADFDFGVPVDKQFVTVFLVCNYNGKSVVKLPSDKWDKFSFFANAQNQLLAVLPDDKIAVFSPSDFAALDVEALKKAGKHTFKMRVLDEKVVDIAAIDGALAGR